jgi:hypothetical protein
MSVTIVRQDKSFQMMVQDGPLVAGWLLLGFCRFQSFLAVRLLLHDPSRTGGRYEGTCSQVWWGRRGWSRMNGSDSHGGSVTFQSATSRRSATS